MATIEFNFQGNSTIIQCNPEEKMKKIIDKLLMKLGGKNKEELTFLYNGQIVDENLTFNEQASEMDKRKSKMSILVFENA